MKAVSLNESSKDDFMAAVQDNKPTLFLCYANWCGHCIRFKPTWDKIKRTLSSNKDVHVVEVEYDFIGLLPRTLQNIRGFPTIQIVKNGRVAKEYQGDREHDAIVSFATQHPRKASLPTPAKKSPSSPTLKKKKAKSV